MRAAELLVRDPEPLVGRGSERVADDVVMLEQELAGDVTAQFDVAEDAEALVLGGLVVGPVTDLIFGWSAATLAS